MRRQLRPVDACVAVAVVVLLGIVCSLRPAQARGPLAALSVAEAIGLLTDEPLTVRGWLVTRGHRTLLCDGPRCAGARLAVAGLGLTRPTGRALVLGTVTGDRIVPVRARTTGRRATL